MQKFAIQDSTDQIAPIVNDHARREWFFLYNKTIIRPLPFVHIVASTLVAVFTGVVSGGADQAHVTSTALVVASPLPHEYLRLHCVAVVVLFTGGDGRRHDERGERRKRR